MTCTEPQALHTLAGGLRDRVSLHLMMREPLVPGATPEGLTMARGLRNAARGIPDSDEQLVRWQRLGIAPITLATA